MNCYTLSFILSPFFRCKACFGCICHSVFQNDTPGFGSGWELESESAVLVGNSAWIVGTSDKIQRGTIDKNLKNLKRMYRHEGWDLRGALLWAPRVCLAKRPRSIAAFAGLVAPTQAARVSWSRPEEIKMPAPRGAGTDEMHYYSFSVNSNSTIGSSGPSGG